MSNRPNRVLLMALLILLAADSCPPVAEAEGPNQVGLVVQKGDGSYVTRCIEFSEPQITGYEVLVRSGLTLEISIGGMGAFVCGIDDEGCPATDCMCDYPPNYWSYWHLSGGQWVYSQMGVGGYMVSPGSVEGWSWGAGTPPAVIPMEQICVPPATDTPIPTATRTPSPTASATPTPTETWTPSPTASATPAPTDTQPPSATPTEAPTLAPASAEVPPTATSMPSDTPVSTATPTATRAGTKAPPSPSVVTGIGSPTPSPTATPAVTVTTAASPAPVQPEPSPTQASVTTSLASVVTMPTLTAVAGDIATALRPGQEVAGPKTESLLTRLSFGAGVAYLFFGVFVLILGALLVFVTLKQR